MKSSLVNILMISNDVTEVMNVQDIFKSNKVSNPLFIAQSSEEALELLGDNNNVKNKIEIPCIILLDMNLSETAVNEFLKQLNESGQSKDVNLFLLTSGTKDRTGLINFTIVDSIVKPVTFGKFVSAISILHKSWQLYVQS